jgi:hypothetical protein
MRIATVVEGHGDVQAVPVLIRRCAKEECDPAVDVSLPHPVRIPRSKLLMPGELERAVSLAFYQAGPDGGVVVILDADDDCPAKLGPTLLGRASTLAAGRFPVSVIAAKYEFESWFLAAAESLSGHRGLAADLVSPDDPESIRDAKGWLTDHMGEESAYSEVLDQPAFAALMSMSDARLRSDSFDKFYREILAMLHGL